MGLKPVSVSQLNNYIKRILQTDPILGNISVIGEISNLKFHGSGHVYFSLKDAQSTISCFLPRDRVSSLDFKLEEGKEVTVHGYLYLYERGGKYSINIRDMEETGEGQLMAEFRRLQKKLEAEGIFDPALKKALPEFPGKVAVVTSETGAAVRDIIKIITSKNNYVDILIRPVLVQGPRAAADIAAAIDQLNEEYDDIDVMIVGRGGGSMEDLWPFNEEIVAYSIYRSRIPVISAVGHEIDFTISDFAADCRAETPTAAADMAVPDTGKLMEHLDELNMEMNRYLSQRTQLAANRLETMNPASTGRNLQARIAMDYMHCDGLMEAMNHNIQALITALDSRIEAAGGIIKGADPSLILSRGYSLVRDHAGRIVHSAENLHKEDRVQISFAKGSAEAEIISTEKR